MDYKEDISIRVFGMSTGGFVLYAMYISDTGAGRGAFLAMVCVEKRESSFALRLRSNTGFSTRSTQRVKKHSTYKADDASQVAQSQVIELQVIGSCRAHLAICLVHSCSVLVTKQKPRAIFAISEIKLPGQFLPFWQSIIIIDRATEI